MITILTDFGMLDPYVGIMKGVILGINPATPIVDLTHAVGRQAIKQGAWLLAGAVNYFPPQTVFLGVVDPGVGSARRAIAAEAGGYFFVGPDNGLFTYALQSLGGGRVVELSEPSFRLPQVSYSFHGRDIFAPAAAYLSLGTPLEAFGEAVEDSVGLPPPILNREGNVLRGEIVHLDGFGNIESSIGRVRWQSAEMLELPPEGPDMPGPVVSARGVSVRLPKATQQPLQGLWHSYGEVGEGALFALIGSRETIEIGRNRASAAALTGAQLGDPVELILE
ncbi:MAG: SAM-dependent chlorinase/fluorinase [Anaerolineae bacterium]|nr:SAM-dependent chlorinase/fluorinase [Anaerolineae bacterium]